MGLSGLSCDVDRVVYPSLLIDKAICWSFVGFLRISPTHGLMSSLLSKPEDREIGARCHTTVSMRASKPSRPVLLLSFAGQLLALRNRRGAGDAGQVHLQALQAQMSMFFPKLTVRPSLCTLTKTWKC